MLKIKVVSSHCGDFKQKDIITKNYSEYCDKHGYELVLNFSATITSRQGIKDAMLLYWMKIDEIKKNLTDCDYLLWLDTDTFILDKSKPLEHYISADFDFDLLITCENCIQTGAYFFKNTEWSHGLIDKMMAYNEKYNIDNIDYCDDTLALIYMLDEERHMIHGGDKIVSTHDDDIEFLNTIEQERKNGKTGDLLNHIKLVSNYEFMVKHVHVYQSPIKPFIIHIPGSSQEDKYRFLKYYSENEMLNWKDFKI